MTHPPIPSYAEAAALAEYRKLTGQRLNDQAFYAALRVYERERQRPVDEKKLPPVPAYPWAKLAREPVEKCEAGCADPVVAHDPHDVPLCQGCADLLRVDGKGGAV
ncbi:MAG: hypothetical protein P4L85_14195 [Paludisphaera borealis]|uniref:hypothetical protein n=1 Tax=Paludisphaera borealis TaxID=1387353 RepID=UPI002849D9EE|nr:hypothetical protein [Paludisphaera borealis]MDR3620497.1 hypothetical protein [Paludisphaera borealis]